MDSSSGKPNFTQGERNVMALLANGLNVGQVADILLITQTAVRDIAKAAKAKAEAHVGYTLSKVRYEVAAFLLARGWLD